MPTRHTTRAAQSLPAGPPSNSERAAGTLYVVATPIGNLGDLSARAREVLGSVALIAAEDTRHSGQLLRNLAIGTRLVSLHQHNEAERVPEILAALQRGESVALVCDAGTPLVSDPGYRLVRAVAAAGFNLSAIPGACAAIAALSVAGLRSDRFSFEGFLAAKSAARRAQLAQLAQEPRTMIFYEAPHRLAECLADLGTVLGHGRSAVVARELTKAFETIYRGTLAELAQTAQRDADMQRGEIVILVAGAEVSATPGEEAELDRVLRVLLVDLPVAQAAQIAATLTGASRNRAYKRALELAKSSELRDPGSE